jgi:hypothetical protein
MENAYSLVCNMWKVHTRPTSASDFFFKGREGWGIFGWVRSIFGILGPQVWSDYFLSDHCWCCHCLLTLTGIVLFRRFFTRKVSIGSVVYFQKWSFYVRRKTSMAYPGFEPGPPRSEARSANHCAIGAPDYRSNQFLCLNFSHTKTLQPFGHIVDFLRCSIWE